MNAQIVEILSHTFKAKLTGTCEWLQFNRRPPEVYGLNVRMCK